MDRKVSVVVSVYNEEKALEEYYKGDGEGLKIPSAGTMSCCSSTTAAGTEASDSGVPGGRGPGREGGQLSRNFGHEAAMIAGLDYSSGDAVICMDADLQHPPECIPRILEKMEEGYEVVNMVRTKNKTAGLVKTSPPPASTG